MGVWCLFLRLVCGYGTPQCHLRDLCVLIYHIALLNEVEGPADKVGTRYGSCMGKSCLFNSEHVKVQHDYRKQCLAGIIPKQLKFCSALCRLRHTFQPLQ